MKRLILLAQLLMAPFCFGKGHDFNDYQTAFLAYAPTQNPWISETDAKEVASTNWALASGNWLLARRIAAEEGAECRLRILAYLPLGTPTKGIPRSDLLGSHYNLLAQEAHRLGLIQDPKNWFYSDEFDQLKAQCWKNPAYGTWITGQAYVRKANEIGLDRASHWWQMGQTWFEDRVAYETDGYLNTIWSKERLFDTMVPGAPKKARAPKKR